MEVKMQYVVDLEDIPSEVSDLLPGHGVLASILNRLRDNLAEKNVEHAILDFQEAKREIYLLNRRILDLEGVAQGYMNIVHNRNVGPANFEGIEESEDVVMVEE